MDVGSANTAASRALVRGLAANGVRNVCISPGSRSTPLTIAFADQSTIRPWLHLDERSAAFFALGLARQTGEPVALVCTSGTASANWLPAAVEANLSRIPLILLTTDRPPSLRDRGAAQTMDQVGLYGRQVRWALDLPLPTGAPGDELQFATFARRAVHASLSPLPGPVHLNVPFDELLMGTPATHPAPVTLEAGPLPADPPSASGAELDAAASALSRTTRPIVVAGPETGDLRAAAIVALAHALGAPILADPLSGLRTGPHDRSRVLDSFDAVVRDPRSDALRPDAVIQFGGPPTSKALNGLLAKLRGVPFVLADLPGGFRDANNAANHLVFGSPESIATGLAQRVTTSAAPSWTDAWLAADRRARDAMQSGLRAFTEPFEGRVFTELQELLPEGSTIVAGNSMPVRDMDSFIVSDAKTIHCVSNRGANGIDGVNSSALGAAAAASGRVVLVIGDISFFHDMNGLWASAKHGLDLTIVLVNNGGGGIFHYLPQAAHNPELFETWFGTPTGLDFRHAAALYGATYEVASDWATFRSSAASDSPGLRIIEVPTDRTRNTAMHRELWTTAAEAAFSREATLA